MALKQPKVTQGTLKCGLTEMVMKKSADLMNAILGTNYALLTKVWGFHWNMTGPMFHPTHSWFQTLYENLAEDVDATAERVRAMGGIAHGSIKDMLKDSILTEQSGPVPSIPTMIKITLTDYETSVKQMRDAVAVISKMNPQNDGDLNFLQDMIMRREKDAWMLRSNS